MAVAEPLPYRSPIRRLARFFEQTEGRSGQNRRTSGDYQRQRLRPSLWDHLFRHRHLGATVQNVRRRITQALAAE